MLVMIETSSYETAVGSYQTSEPETSGVNNAAVYGGLKLTPFEQIPLQGVSHVKRTCPAPLWPVQRCELPAPHTVRTAPRCIGQSAARDQGRR